METTIKTIEKCMILNKRDRNIDLNNNFYLIEEKLTPPMSLAEYLDNYKICFLFFFQTST